MKAVGRRRLSWCAGLVLAGLGSAALAQTAPRLKLELKPPVQGRAVPAPSTAADRSFGLPQDVADTSDLRACADVPNADSGAPLRLGSVVQAVVCRSTLVRQGDGIAMQAQAALDRALGVRQPAVGVSAAWGGSRGAGTVATAAVRLELLLYDFGSSDAATQQAREALLAALGEQRAEALAAVAQAALLFGSAQSAFGRFDAAAVNLRTAQDNARAAAARHGAGAATLSERLHAQTALALAELDHKRAMTQWFIARGALAIAMGWRADSGVELQPLAIDGEAGDGETIDLAALLDEARLRHPRIAAARARWREAESRAAAIRAERWGSVGLSTRAGQFRSSSDSSVSSTISATIEWSVPLFDRGLQRSRELDAQGQAKIRSVGIDDAQQLIAQQVWQEGQSYLGERAGLRAGRAALDSADEALRVASERFRLGVGGFVDVLTAQTAAANARFQWVDARANLLRARLRLAAAVGRIEILPRP